MTVEKNVAFGLERRRVPKADVKRRVAEALDLVELGAARAPPPDADVRRPAAARRARAGARQPAARRCCSTSRSARSTCACASSCRSSCSHIQREVGITFVHVTHDQEEAMTMADTIAVMRDGRIDQLGSATELYDRPRTEFVANFLGSSNLLDAKPVGRRADIAEFEADGARLRAPAPLLDDDAGAGPCASACARRRSRCAPPRRRGRPTGTTCSWATSRTPASSASRRSTSSAPMAATTSRCSPRTPGSSTETIGPGRRVAASWDPQHTFIVAKETGNDTAAA